MCSDRAAHCPIAGSLHLTNHSGGVIKKNMKRAWLFGRGKKRSKECSGSRSWLRVCRAPLRCSRARAEQNGVGTGERDGAAARCSCTASSSVQLEDERGTALTRWLEERVLPLSLSNHRVGSDCPTKPVQVPGNRHDFRGHERGDELSEDAPAQRHALLYLSGKHDWLSQLYTHTRYNALLRSVLNSKCDPG